jgi:hypothetical protein
MVGKTMISDEMRGIATENTWKMTDIVERLLELVAVTQGDPVRCGAIAEAADEIERLRAENTRLAILEAAHRDLYRQTSETLGRWLDSANDQIQQIAKKRGGA